MAHRRPRQDMLPSGGLNLTPLLDVIFILIFFFLLATQVRDRERFLDLELPQSDTAAERVDEQEVAEIELEPGGGLLLDGQAMTEPELEAELSRRVREEGLLRANVVSSGDEVYQRIVDVWGICQRAGIEDVTSPVRPRE